MDASEDLVRQHLEFRGFSDIVFEPDGNIPPDFVLNGRIAVEVRRLNQSLESRGKLRGLEETAYPLHGKIETLLKSLGPCTSGSSWFVFHHFSRPIPPWSDLETKIKECCADVASRTNLKPGAHLEAKLHENFELSFLHTSTKHEYLFMMGGSSDHDAGGWVLSEMEKNIQYCVDDKTEKVRPHRHKYEEWWLALVDYIGYGLSQEDYEELKATSEFRHDWDKILLIAPLNPTRGFEI